LVPLLSEGTGESVAEIEVRRMPGAAAVEGVGVGGDAGLLFVESDDF
jgi:hypothetical protein